VCCECLVNQIKFVLVMELNLYFCWSEIWIVVVKLKLLPAGAGAASARPQIVGPFFCFLPPLVRVGNTNPE
jgi:hypothetical protein